MQEDDACVGEAGRAPRGGLASPPLLSTTPSSLPFPPPSSSLLLSFLISSSAPSPLLFPLHPSSLYPFLSSPLPLFLSSLPIPSPGTGRETEAQTSLWPREPYRGAHQPQCLPASAAQPQAGGLPDTHTATEFRPWTLAVPTCPHAPGLVATMCFCCTLSSELQPACEHWLPAQRPVAPGRPGSGQGALPQAQVLAGRLP